MCVLPCRPRRRPALMAFKNPRWTPGPRPPLIPHHDFRPAVGGEVTAAVVPHQMAHLSGIAAHGEFISGTEGNLPDLDALFLGSRHDPSLVGLQEMDIRDVFQSRGSFGCPEMASQIWIRPYADAASSPSVGPPNDPRHRAWEGRQAIRDRAVRTKSHHLLPGRDGSRSAVGNPYGLFHPWAGTFTSAWGRM